MNAPLFTNKPRRLAEWDYSWNGAYFITFCTVKRASSLGYITRLGDDCDAETVFIPSRIGSACIEAIEKLQEEDASFQIDCYVVMPNHVHLLVLVDRRSDEEPLIKDKRVQLIQRIVAKVKSHAFHVARRELGMKRVWQRSFHDHIVRDERELSQIREYIANNPAKWALDRFYVA